MYIDEVDKLTKKVIGEISSDLNITTTLMKLISPTVVISIAIFRLSAVRIEGMYLERVCSKHY